MKIKTLSFKLNFLIFYPRNIPNRGKLQGRLEKVTHSKMRTFFMSFSC
jgi:hypothetical protein